jgi:DNA primase
VIACWQEGVRNMVAVSGSSLTQEMIDRIIKQTHAKEIVLCFDGDLGGMKAADRALRSLQELALTGDITLKILTLPEGCDPADLADAMPELIADAPHWVQWWFDREVGQIDLNDPRQIVAAEAGVKRILRVLPTGALREFVRRRAKEVLKAVPDIQPAKVQTQKQINRCHWAERRALRLYLHDTGSRPALSDLDYTDPLMIQAWGLILAIEGTLPPESGLLASSFSVVIQGADEAVMDACRSLVRPIPEVLRVITADPLNELQGAMDVLLSEACQASNSDHGRMGLTVTHDEVDSLQRS